MKKNNFKPYKDNNYFETSINQGFYSRKLAKSKKLYMDEYDRLKKQIYKRREDKKFQDMLTNYYDDFNKLTKKHPFLQNYQDYNIPKQTNTFDLFQYEIKKKNLNTLFFKHDIDENYLNFDVTDNLIESMNDGNNTSFLKSFEIKEDYKKRLKLYNKDARISETDINNINFYSAQRNVNLSIISDKKNKVQQENKSKQIKIEKKEENDEENNLIENYSNNIRKENLKQIEEKIENQKTKIILKRIKEEQEDILTKYKNSLKKNNFPCFEFLLNPNSETDYLPPIYIQDIPDLDKKETESEKISEYNDFIFNEENKQNKENENNLKSSNQDKNEKTQIPLLENKINSNRNEEFTNPQFYNIDKEKEENIEEDYENEKFDENINNKNSNEELNNDNYYLKDNKESQNINQYPNGELKMLNDIIQDNKFPQFEQIINPYYQTDYLPPEIFIQPMNQSQKQAEGEEVKETVSRANTAELALNNYLEEENKNQLPMLEDNIKENQKPMLENIIKGNNDYNIPLNNEYQKEEDKNKISNDNKEKEINLNNFGVKNKTKLISVEEMINKNFQNKVLPEEIKEEDYDEHEYDDFEGEEI